MPTNISDYITYYEATKSMQAIKHGIPNHPNNEQIKNMIDLANNIFEPLRKALEGYPIFIASFFRSYDLNEKIGGADGSQHMANKGAAFDLDNDGKDKPNNLEIFEYIRDHLEFDQLINEFPDENGKPSWVHCSYNKGNNRGQVLKAIKVGRLTKYIDIS